jgi:NAD(P)-dependent dehydrogenase (short-subunit alcohol dehydrogenase family)
VNCILVGNHSDIARGLQPLLEADGYDITGWNRGWRRKRIIKTKGSKRWDLALFMLGSVAPVGRWHSHTDQSWEQSIKDNLLMPLRLLRANWATHAPGASVCFFAGSNPNTIMDGYSAYNTGKMALLKLVEQLDYETADAKFFALAPGIVNTKIHQPTLEAGWYNPKLEAALSEKRSTPIPRIYECLKWCIAQDKEVVGGRNICVSDDWDFFLQAKVLKSDPDLYKLRRVE